MQRTHQGGFKFINPGPLSDGELELLLVEQRMGDPTRGLVPAYFFEMQVDGCKAGLISLRIGDSKEIVMYAGHIGYSVEPEYRGHHYAERACRLVLPLAKAHGLDPLWITCNPDNMPSRRTCERLGATMVEIVLVPKNCEMYKRGDHEKCRYRLDLT